MRIRVPLIGLALLLIYGCGPASVPCGIFSFAGAPHTSRGIDVTLNFDFNPATCGSSCTCNPVAYVQIVRIIDLDTGNFLSPNSDQTNRIVTGRADSKLNGWAIDRLSGRVWGFYGRNNDGTFSGTLTPGSDTADAILRDSPSGWPDNSWFDAVSVPVCIQASSACANRLLAYYYWQFFVGNDGKATNPIKLIARKWHCDAVDQSVIEWNNDAPGLSKNSFPAFTRMGC